MIIYKATNLTNGKIYIGQTIKPLNKRRIKHICEAFKYQKTRFHRAIVKYGAENFKWEVLEDNIEDLKNLDKREIYWISYFDSFNKGYNDTKGGNSIRGYRFTNEDKKKMSLSHIGKSNGQHSKETKNKISDSQRGQNNSMFGRKGIKSPRIKYKYILESPFGEFFETYCINEFCKQNKMNRVNLYKAFINNRNYKGWKISRKIIKKEM